MKILYISTRGTSDPTGASIPLHIAANGSAAVGQDVTIVLGGDATELVSRKAAEGVEGVGVPPARELFAKLREGGAAVYV
jgi:predicted peroxiredoxin